MHESAPPPRRWNAALPARYDDVFARALAKDPAQRFASAGEFVGALDLRELEYVLEPVCRTRRPRRSRTRTTCRRCCRLPADAPPARWRPDRLAAAARRWARPAAAPRRSPRSRP